MEKPKIAYIPKGLTVDYEKEYGRLIRQEVTFVPTVEDDFLYQLRFLERWYKKSVPQLIELERPDAAYAVAVELCRQLPDFVFRRDIEGYLKPKKPRLRKLIEGAFSALVDSVKAWNNEEKRRWVCDFIFKQTKYYHDFRGLQKVMLQMMPSEPNVGEPVAVVREKSDEGQEDGQRCQVGNDLAVGQHQYAVRTDIRVLIYLLSGLDERRCRRWHLRLGL